MFEYEVKFENFFFKGGNRSKKLQKINKNVWTAKRSTKKHFSLERWRIPQKRNDKDNKKCRRHPKMYKKWVILETVEVVDDRGAENLRRKAQKR